MINTVYVVMYLGDMMMYSEEDRTALISIFTDRALANKFANDLNQREETIGYMVREWEIQKDSNLPTVVGLNIPYQEMKRLGYVRCEEDIKNECDLNALENSTLE